MRDFLATLILLGVLQGAVLAYVLWRRRANQLANRILATLVAAVATMLLLAQVEHRWGFSGHPHLLALSQPLPFLFGPLLYLYAVALTRPVLRFNPRWFAHALPFVADVLYMAQVFYLKDAGEKVALAQASNVGIAPLAYHLVNGVEVAQALVYLVLTWRALDRYGAKIRGYFSDLAQIDLRWLRALVLAHVGVWSVVLFAVVLRWTGQSAHALGAVVRVAASLSIFLTGYVSLWQPELAQKATAAKVAEKDPSPSEDERSADAEAPRPVAEVAAPEPPRPKYQRNRLEDAEAKELVTKLEVLMSEKALYREPGLTLPTLADALGATPHTLSQVLNVHVGKSFFVFVNTFRAEALKEALADPARAGRGVLELAFEVGFSSKSTLNSFFKKHTGMTPTEFRARAQAANSPVKSRA